MDKAENPLAPSLKLLWEGLPAPEKGPRPKLSLDQIIVAAIELADSHGVEALSMRALAKELGVGTMSLYRYVPSKTELLNLMLDSVTAPQPQDLPSDEHHWLQRLEALAWAERRVYLEHPWMLQANWTRPVMGPNSVGALEAYLEVLKGVPLSDQDKMNVISAVEAYVMGAVRQEVLWQNSAEESGMSDDQFWQYQLPAMESAMASGKYPRMASLGEDTFDASWEESFITGLQIFLDGLEKYTARRRS